MWRGATYQGAGLHSFSHLKMCSDIVGATFDSTATCLKVTTQDSDTESLMDVVRTRLNLWLVMVAQQWLAQA